MSSEPFFKWQNLLAGFCPKCGLRTLERRAAGIVYHNCEDEDRCGFGISEQHLLELLSNPDHPIRVYLTGEQVAALEKYLKTKS